MIDLPEFYLHKYRFNLVAVEDIVLPEYKGFALRGMLGHTLRKILCVSKQKDCAGCLLGSRCVYHYLFETAPSERQPQGRMFRDYPRPYVITPPLAPEREIKRKKTLSFDLVLIGRANDYLPYVIFAFEEMGRRGIGKDKGRFIIKGIESLDYKGMSTVVYANQVITDAGPSITFADLNGDVPDVTELTIDFETPARIEVKNHLVNKPPSFRILMEALTRRAMLLNYYHCGGVFDAGFTGGLEGCDALQIRASRITWVDLERYSSRQKTGMFQGGIKGQVTYSGALAQYIPLLRLGEFIHVGKSTTFGLGKYRLEYG
jgi:CRISPR-associated endoribonuclease Cas6